MVANGLPRTGRIASVLMAVALSGCIHAQTITPRVVIVQAASGSSGVDIPTFSSSYSLGLRIHGAQAKELFTAESYGVSTYPGFYASSSRGTEAVPTAVQSGNHLGILAAGGYDGATLQRARGYIGIDAGGNWSGGSTPTTLSFWTTDVGSATVTNRWQVESDGSLLPFTNDTYTLGSAAKRVSEGHFTDLTIYGTCTGCSGASLPVIDTTSIVFGSSDPTKLMRFEVDGFTTMTTRVLTPQDQNYTLAGLDATGQIFTTNNQTLVNAGGLSGILSWRNSNDAGISGAELYDSIGGFKGWLGYANSTHAIAPDSTFIGTYTVNSVVLGTNSTARWKVDGGGDFLPYVDETGNIGTASFKPSSITTKDLTITGTCTGCSVLPVVDTTSIVKGSSDATKLMRFEVDGFTTGTTRVLTPQDQSYTLAGLDATGQVFTTSNQFLVNAGGLSGIMQFRNSNAAGISGPELYDSTGALKGWMGYANSTHIISTGSVFIGAFTVNPIAFATNSTERFRIDASGWLLGGITSTDLSISAGSIVSSQTIASVTAATNASVGSFKAVAANYVAIGSSHTGSGTDLPLSFFTSGTRQWDIDTSGNLIPQTTNDLGASGSRVDNGYFTNINISGTCTGCSALPVVDTTAIVKGSSDATKLMRFEVDGFTTGTTRVLTPQDQNYTIAGLDATGQVFTTINQVLVSAGASGVIQYRNSSTSGLSGPEIYNSSGALKGWLGYANGSFSFAPSSMAIAAYTVDPITFSTNSTERFRVDASGWLLGGITSTDLTISPGAIVTSQTIASVTAATNASVGSFKAVSSNYLSINSSHTGSGTDLPIAFFTAGVEAFRITNAGNMLGGITSTDVSVGVGAVVTNRSFVSVTGTSNASLGSFQAIASNYFAISSSRTGSGTYLPIAFFTSATRRWDITTGGDLVPTSGVNIGTSGSRVGTVYASNIDVSGTITAVKTVRNSAGTGTCTLIFQTGLLVGGSC